MKQYTTEWAKEILRQFLIVKAVAQDENGQVWLYDCNPICDERYGEWGINNCSDDKMRVCFMLEHPNGWQNSKVTRES